MSAVGAACAIRRELHCEDCHRDYSVWYADNDLWNAVMRPNGQQEGEPFLCPTCFLVRAAVAGACVIARVTHAPNDPAVRNPDVQGVER